MGTTFFQQISVELRLIFLLFVDIDARDMATTEQLNLVLFFVDRIVIDSCIFSCVPIEDELSIVQTANFALFLEGIDRGCVSVDRRKMIYLDNAQISFLDCGFFTFAVGVCKGERQQIRKGCASEEEVLLELLGRSAASSLSRR